MIGLFPVILLFILFLLNVPIAFSLIGSTLFYFVFIDKTMPMDMVAQYLVKSTDSFPLLAIPFFIMVGAVMNHSGISSSLMKMAEVLTGHLKGGLAQVNVLLSVLMGGISGSANADAAMQCKILVPEMKKRGYSPAFAAAITAASSSISPVIPPGITLIIYALIANVSVSKMFVAGYMPGFLMALALMITVSFIAQKRGYSALREKRATLKENIVQIRESIWALLVPFGIILGMRFGVFTPTEAGAVAVLFCTIVGVFVYKKLKWHHIPEILKETLYGTSVVMLIIIGAKVFGYYLTLERIPQTVTEFLIGFTSSKIVLLLLINILLLFVGMFIEGGAAMIILAPLLVPAVTNLGVDPVHFGIIVIVNIMIGGITPPFGSMMFMTCSLVRVKLTDFVKECTPYIIALLIVLLILTYIPQIVLFLPNLIG